MDVTITCKCPGEHGTDTVTFFDRLDFDRALAVSKSLKFIEATDPEVRAVEVLAKLSKFYLFYGIKSWTLVGPDKKKLEVNDAAIRSQLFEHPDFPLLVDEADEQYQAQVLLPLANRASRSSRRSQTERSTSPKPRKTGPTRPKPSKRSSISTIPTADTEETSSSPDGAYSSSQSLELAAS